MNKLRNIANNAAHRISISNLYEFPYKHIVIDDFLDRDLVHLAEKQFPTLDSPIWEKQDDAVEKKYRSQYKSEFDFPTHLNKIVRVLNSSMVMSAISKKIGIPKLIPDPYFTGGGLNVMKRGGLLDVHVDGNYHDATGLNRRVNVILFLSRLWEKKWRGEFGIYDMEEKLVEAVYPQFNRLVIFDTHDKSYHGSPDPITCPEDEERKSLILYYYTKAKRPRNQTNIDEPHSALWKKKNFTDKNGDFTRSYK